MAVSAIKRIFALALVFAALTLSAQDNENLDDGAQPKATSTAGTATGEPKESTEPALKPKTNTTSTNRSVTTSESTSTTSTSSNSQSIEAGNELYINSKTSFELKAQDDSSMVDYIEYKINNGEFIKYSKPIIISQEGIAQLTYRSVDRAGNIEPSKLLTVVVDNSPPSVVIVPTEPLFITQGANYTSKNNTFSFKAEDSLSGVGAIEYAINDASPATYAQDNPIRVEKDGSNLIRYSATDNSGNKSRESSVAVIIDNKPPVVEIIPNVPLVDIDGKTYSKKGNTFQIRAFDGESGVRRVLIKVDGEADFRPYVEGIIVDAQGEHKIEAKGIDNVGNESEVKSVTFLVDVNPPASEIKKIVEEKK
ncbi:MAG: hypothetical protein MH321_18390 [Leptospiraceae bacterium]|nr:hypothetical protein [Leptospiraceae bacterium]